MIDPNDRYTNNLLRARAEYIRRQNGKSKPKGQKYKGVFHPAPSENYPCCIEFFHSVHALYAVTDFYAHCCSAEHVAHMYGVDPAAVANGSLVQVTR